MLIQTFVSKNLIKSQFGLTISFFEELAALKMTKNIVTVKFSLRVGGFRFFSVFSAVYVNFNVSDCTTLIVFAL